jgi:hypothetical protein
VAPTGLASPPAAIVAIGIFPRLAARVARAGHYLVLFRNSMTALGTPYDEPHFQACAFDIAGVSPGICCHVGVAVERQDGWRWCRKCQGLWFGENNTRGACPTGGGHQQTGSGNYRLMENSPGAAGQEGWRWCRKCQGLWFSGNNTRGACPAGGGHQQAGSGNYRLVENSPGGSGQANWRWCRKCQGLWFGGGDGDGKCPSGGRHDRAGSGDYRLRHT